MTTVLDCDSAVRGRFVSIYQLHQGFLELCEVEVFGGECRAIPLNSNWNHKEQSIDLCLVFSISYFGAVTHQMFIQAARLVFLLQSRPRVQ